MITPQQSNLNLNRSQASNNLNNQLQAPNPAIPISNPNSSIAPVQQEIDYFKNELNTVPRARQDSEGVYNFVWAWDQVQNKYINPQEGAQYQFKPFVNERNPKTAFLTPDQSQYPENHLHSVQYHKQRNNGQYLQQIGLSKYNKAFVYKNDLDDTLSRLNNAQKTKLGNQAKKFGLILSGIFLGLAILFFILFLFSQGGWAAFWIVLAIISFLVATFFLIYALFMTSKNYELQLQDRRSFIRNYLRTENERYYHKRGLHWKPSRECSYLILKLGFVGQKDEEEVWLTGRNRSNITPWGQYPNNKVPSDMHAKQSQYIDMWNSPSPQKDRNSMINQNGPSPNTSQLQLNPQPVLSPGINPSMKQIPQSPSPIFNPNQNPNLNPNLMNPNNANNPNIQNNANNQNNAIQEPQRKPKIDENNRRSTKEEVTVDSSSLNNDTTVLQGIEMPVMDRASPRRTTTQIQPNIVIQPVQKSPTRDPKLPTIHQLFDNPRPHTNTPGKKYVNKGISKAAPVNEDLDNSILQPLNSSIMQDRTPLVVNQNPSKRYVNQDVVKHSAISPSITTLTNIQKGRNPLSPKNSYQLKENISYSNLNTHHPSSTVQHSIQNQNSTMNYSSANQMPWSSIPQKEIVLQNAQKVEERPIIYRQQEGLTVPTGQHSQASFINYTGFNRSSIQGQTPTKYSNANRLGENYVTPGNVTNVTRQVVSRPSVNYQSNTPQQMDDNWVMGQAMTPIKN